MRNIKWLTNSIKVNEKMIFNVILFLIGGVLGLTVGVGFTSNKTVSWTDVVSASSAAMTAIIVYMTYSKWLLSKQRDDAYQVSKNYIDALSSIHMVIDDMILLYDQVIPKEGSFVYTKDQSLKMISDAMKETERLRLHLKTLHYEQIILSFWGVSLAMGEQDLYNKTIQSISKIIRYSSVLDSNVRYWLVVDDQKSSFMYESFALLELEINNCRDLITKRYEKKYPDLFTYN